MVLPSSGTITLSQVQTEFGGSSPTGINEYYKGGGLVPATFANAAIPSSGTISLTDFYSGDGTGLTNNFTSRGFLSQTTFGVGGAAVSSGGNYVVLSNNTSVFIYKRSGTSMSLQQTISTNSSNAYVAINAVGDFLVLARRGAGLVSQAYSRSGTVWSVHSTIGTGIANGQVSSIAMNSDGTTLAIGQINSGVSSSVYIYVRSGTSWSQQANFVGSDTTPSTDNFAGNLGSTFGSGVALTNDGNRLICGAPGISSTTGAAYIFTRSGTSWSQEQKITPDVASALFGVSVGINVNDGTTVAVGASLETNPITNQGFVYVFTRSGSTWTKQTKINRHASSGARDGDSVLLNSTGALISIGSNTSGASRSSTWYGGSGASWTLSSTGVSGAFPVAASPDGEVQILYNGTTSTSWWTRS